MVEQTPPEKLDKIIHASLIVGETVLMGSDAPPQRFEKPQGFSVSLLFTDPVEAERIFDALAENGTVQMPPQETFWAARFRMLLDRFGTPWTIDCDMPA